MKQKTITLLLALFALFSVTACSGDLYPLPSQANPGSSSPSGDNDGNTQNPDDGENTAPDEDKDDTGTGEDNGSGDAALNSDAFKPLNHQFYYGRSFISSDEQQAYDAILLQLLNFKNNEIYHEYTKTGISYYSSIKIDLENHGIKNMSQNQLMNILMYLTLDEARAFHISRTTPKPGPGLASNPGTTPFQYTSNGGISFFWLQISSSIGAYEDYEKMIQTIEDNISPMLESVKDKKYTEAQKAKILHDKYLAHVSYGGMASTSAGNILGAFYEKNAAGDYKVVCEGYSFGLMYLFHRAGIKAIYIAGGVNASSATSNWIMHAWNKVLIGEKWYNIDSTWDDSIMPGSTDSNTDNFLKSDDFFKNTIHHLENQTVDNMGNITGTTGYKKMTGKDLPIASEDMSPSKYN